MLSVLKTNIKIIYIVVIAFFMIDGSCFAGNKEHCKGIIISYQLNVRNIPSRFGDIMAVLPQGQRVDVVKDLDNENWLALEYKGKIGYVRNRPKYIELECLELQTVGVQKAAVNDGGEISQPADEPGVNDNNSARDGDQSTAVDKEAPRTGDESPSAKKDNKKPDVKQAEINQHKEVARKKIKAKIQSQEELARSFSKKEKEIIEGLNGIDYALNQARIKVRAISSEISALEARIEQLDNDRSELFDKIAYNQIYAGKRLKALYKMNMLGSLDAADMPATVFEFFLQQNAMKRIIVNDYALLDKQRANYRELEVLEDKFELEMKAKTVLEVDYKDQIRIKQQESYKRELILKEIRRKKRLSLAAIDSLKEAAIKLDKQIFSLNVSKEIIELEQFSFASYKGRLLKPARGKIITRFGPSRSKDKKTLSFQKGIDIKVERGEPVKSVFKGKVMFSEWLMGYGNLLIINHGDNYYTLYAHLEELFKKKGETVETGEVIATAGDTGSIKGLCLHFELRHHGKPVNPMNWLKKGA